ncbi:hypothetical protein N0K08_02785 [Acidovorax sp. Be4]|uniref:Uncharacterized protein n=1 Tax=Acidovorax bellezanensis TaxID=2976702 RepID=A0ABT2PI95_9BURK|nr:hypothetical protein [Acidovorax sp. Be4]
MACEKRRLAAAKNFGEMTARWLADARMAAIKLLDLDLLGTL